MAKHFSNSRSRITAWVARFLLKRSWRTVPVARHLTNVSVCFIQLSKSCGESVLLSYKSRWQSRKEGGILNHAPLKTAYSSGSKSISSISKPKIILISASLIRPFNSMQSRKEGGILNHAPLKTAYSSGSKSISSISKPKIILISASLIRPFNSISTTI